MNKTDELLNYLIATSVGDGAVVIAPHREPFRFKERSFLDGIRSCPAHISAPAGVNPFTDIFGKKGRWMFVWIPESS